MSNARSMKTRSIKTLGLVGLMAVVAMAAVAAVGAASASAADPEFLVLFECAKKVGGLWHEKMSAAEGGACLGFDSTSKSGWDPVAGTGKAVAAGEKVPFTATGGPGQLETTTGIKIDCAADTKVGEIVGPQEVLEVVVTFTGCKLLVTGEPSCQSTGMAAGEILTEPLMGELGFITTVPLDVGLDLLPETGELLAVFLCGTTEIDVLGSVIGLITPINEPAGQFTLEFKQTAGVQEPTKFEGGPEDVLTTDIGTEAVKSGLEGSETITTSEPVEIMAAA